MGSTKPFAALYEFSTRLTRPANNFQRDSSLQIIRIKGVYISAANTANGKNATTGLLNISELFLQPEASFSINKVGILTSVVSHLSRAGV